MPESEILTPFVPRELIVAPFFAAVKQTEPRELTIDGKRWTIGIEHPTKRRGSPALDMRHARACFALLTFRDRLEDGRTINFSMNEFCKRYAHSQGGRFARDVLKLLYDLQETFVAREIENDTIEYFQILGEITIHQKAARRSDALLAVSSQGEMWLDRVALSPEFFGLMTRWEELARIRLDVLNDLKSSKAQAIYTYIPSRAVHHTKESPFQITAINVLEQIGAPVPPQKSKRKQVFCQHGEKSILNQLDGSEIANGSRLRVAMEETRDKSDFKLIFWTEKREGETKQLAQDNSSKMLDAWRKSGRSQGLYEQRLKSRKPLSDYHRELLERAEVKLDGNERFFENAAALLGVQMDQILSETKGDALEGDPGNNPTGRIIYRLMSAIGKA